MEPEQTPGCDTCIKYNSEFCPNPGAQGCSEWECQYYDALEAPVTLDTLCRKEPVWAANRIRAELKEGRSLRARLAEVERERDEANARQDRYSFLANDRANTIRLLETERDEARGKLARIFQALQGYRDVGSTLTLPDLLSIIERESSPERGGR
jgi:hypothetical protein